MNKHSLPDAMREALALTRSGRLVAATRAIQGALGGAAAPEAARETAPDGAPRLAPPTGGRRSERPRRPLGAVLAALREGRRGLDLPGLRRGAPRPAPEPLPEGARFEARTHTGAAGARRYKLYVPSGQAATRPRGLVVMLHGCTQDPDDFAAGTTMNALAERHGLVVAYPAQERGANPNLCWNWFAPEHQAKGAGEPEILAGLARALAAEFGVADGRVFAAGLSAGGAMAAVLGQAYPDVFAAVGVHSGLPAGAASDVVSAFAAMRGDGAGVATRGGGTRTIVFHGVADKTVHVSNAERLAEGVHPDAAAASPEHGEANGRRFRRVRVADGPGPALLEVWTIDGAGHAWSGGSPAGSYADAAGPNASGEMVRFFLEG